MITLNDEKYYTPKEIAKKFDVSPQTIAIWRKYKGLKAYKMSERKYFYSETEVEKFVRGE
jgi:hypothetical protein